MCHDTDDVDDSESTDRAVEKMDPVTVRHDWSQSGQPSMTLVEAVAVGTDRMPTDLPPLHRSIDPDALDALLTGEQSSSVTASFRYADTAVWMNRNGTIEVQVDGPLTEGDGD